MEFAREGEGRAAASAMISEAAHAECVRLLELLTNPRVQESWSWVFMKPVDIPGYEHVIKRPMDLGTIKKNLGSKPSRCRFKSHDKFARDVRLVFHNALVYNKADQDVKGSVYAAAQHLLRVFETAYAKAIDSVFRADDAAKAAQREAKEERRKAEGGDARPDGNASSASSHHHHSTGSHSHSHHHREDGEEGSKHRHKHSKKSKKSKKKSKDREKDREHRHASSSSGDSKKKSHRSERENVAAVASSSVTKEVMPRTEAAAPGPSAAVASSSVVKREPSPSGAKMSESEMAACLSLLMKLVKYKEGNISPAAPFLQPVDFTHFPDYRVKVPNRMHLYGVQKKLRSGSYPTIDAFAHDMRLIFSNCLVYNSDVILSKVMRNHAVTLMKLFESQFAKIGGSWPGIPERWKCHQIIHEVLAHRTDGQETAQWFKYPIESYYDSPDQIPYNYYKTVKEPMDIGTVSTKLHLGEYKHVSEFLADMKLVFDNCIRYWKPDPQGQTYCESAETLMRVLRSQSAIFGSSASSGATSREKQRSSSSSSSKVKAVSAAAISSPAQPALAPVASVPSSEHERSKKKSSSSKSTKSSKSSKSRESGGGMPEKDVCLGIMKQLRGHKMKGFRGIEIKTAGPFLTAVDTTKYPDYLTIVSEPMDFAKIERKLKSDRYGSVDEFSADVHLIFSNCHKYNSDPVEGADIRAMATNLRNYFVELCNEKLGPLDGMVSGPTQTLTHSAQVASIPSALAAEPPKPVAPMLSRPPEGRSHSAVTGASSLQKQLKKSPAPSPTKRPLSTSSTAASGGAVPSRDLKKGVEPSIGRKAAEPAVSSSATAAAPAKLPVHVKPVAAAAAPTPASPLSKERPHGSATNLEGLTPEEAKRLRKEMKEKRKKEKKEKKEKKKKKDKERKRDKKEKKERSKSSRSSTQVRFRVMLYRHPVLLLTFASHTGGRLNSAGKLCSPIHRRCFRASVCAFTCCCRCPRDQAPVCVARSFAVCDCLQERPSGAPPCVQRGVKQEEQEAKEVGPQLLGGSLRPRAEPLGQN
jgi:hypothetical protein